MMPKRGFKVLRFLAILGGGGHDSYTWHGESRNFQSDENTTLLACKNNRETSGSSLLLIHRPKLREISLLCPWVVFGQARPSNLGYV